MPAVFPNGDHLALECVAHGHSGVSLKADKVDIEKHELDRKEHRVGTWPGFKIV